MASINNIKIKGLKTFADHEGCTIAQGNVYLNGRKLGFWTQDSWGGPDRYDFDKSILDDAVRNYRDSDRVEDIYKKIFDTDCLMDAIVRLTFDEKSYKKGLPDFNILVIHMIGGHQDGYYTGGYPTKEDVLNSDEYKKFIKSCDPKESGHTTVYMNLDDFDLTV